MAGSNIRRSSIKAGSAAAYAHARKLAKYRDLSQDFSVVPISFETLGSIDEDSLAFLKGLAGRIGDESQDKRKGEFFLQRLA